MKVQLFVTCLIDSMFPEVGEAVVRVLTRAGAQVAFPQGQSCCGQPAYNAGFGAPARRMARQTIEVLQVTEGPVVIPSGSCAAMIRHGYPELFVDDPIWLPRAQALARRIFEFSAFLVDELGLVNLGGEYSGKIAYHPSCHLLRDLGVDRQPLNLLHSLKGAQVHRLSSDCCGFGGVFAVDQAQISSQMLARRLEQIERADADVVVGCDVSCLMQLEGGLRRRGSPVRCVHLAQMLSGEEAGF